MFVISVPIFCKKIKYRMLTSFGDFWICSILLHFVQNAKFEFECTTCSDLVIVADFARAALPVTSIRHSIIRTLGKAIAFVPTAYTHSLGFVRRSSSFCFRFEQAWTAAPQVSPPVSRITARVYPQTHESSRIVVSPNGARD